MGEQTKKKKTKKRYSYKTDTYSKRHCTTYDIMEQVLINQHDVRNLTLAQQITDKRQPILHAKHSFKHPHAITHGNFDIYF